MDDEELARRSILGFGETIAALGRCAAGPDAEIRRAGVLGARIDSAGNNPWFNAAVVPFGAPPPSDDPGLPYCVWTADGAVPGRVLEPEILTPCMGLMLDDPSLELDDAAPGAVLELLVGVEQGAGVPVQPHQAGHRGVAALLAGAGAVLLAVLLVVQLVRVLEGYGQQADVWAVYPTRLSRSPKVRELVRLLADRLVRQSLPRNSA